MTELTEKSKRRTGLLIWLIVSQLLAAVSAIFAFYIGIGYGMADQGLGYSKSVEILIAIFILYPIFPLIMSIGAWMAFVRRRNMLAAILSGLYLLFVPVILFVWFTQPM